MYNTKHFLKMKRIIFLVAAFLSFQFTSAQSGVAIGSNQPHASAILDVTSNNKGFLLPRMTSTARLNISTPPNGLLVMDTSQNRLYQYQDGLWRFFINSDYWSKSTSRDYLYNVSDSIGIGTSIPTVRLDVNGDIRARNNIRTSGSINVTGTAQGNVLTATGNITAGGSAIIGNDLNGDDNLVIDNATATLQLKNAASNKVFFQSSGSDLKLGTNIGNSEGDFYIRMNGDNTLKIDPSSNFTLLKYSGSMDLGKIVMGDKLIRAIDPGNNVLPVMYGRVFSDGYAAAVWPQTGTSTKISIGVYEIDTNISSVSANTSIVVTASGVTVPRICTGRYIGLGKYKVEVFNLQGGHVDTDFYFMIHDPLN